MASRESNDFIPGYKAAAVFCERSQTAYKLNPLFTCRNGEWNTFPLIPKEQRAVLMIMEQRYDEIRDTGYGMLDMGCWIPEAGYWITITTFTHSLIHLFTYSPIDLFTSPYS